MNEPHVCKPGSLTAEYIVAADITWRGLLGGVIFYDSTIPTAVLAEALSLMLPLANQDNSDDTRSDFYSLFLSPRHPYNFLAYRLRPRKKNCLFPVTVRKKIG